MTALLRAVQPTLYLDTDVGMLPLSAHGSTTTAVLATAEAAAAAKRTTLLFWRMTSVTNSMPPPRNTLLRAFGVVRASCG